MKTAFLITAVISLVLTFSSCFVNDESTAKGMLGCADWIITIALFIEALILVTRR